MVDDSGVARWFLAVGAFIYATGFLVAVNYADYLGASGISNELFRAKYVLIGVLCLALPTIVVGAAYGLMELRAIPPKPKVDGRESPMRMTVANVVLVFNLLLTFYVFVMFAPRGYVRGRPWLIWMIFGLTAFGSRMIEPASGIIKVEWVDRFQTTARWTLCAVIVFVLDVFCFWEMRGRLWEVFFPRGAYFLLFVVAIAYSVCRLKSRSVMYPERASRTALWVIGGCSVSLLYVLTVYAFSYGVYPEIAASRGGGDHTEDLPVILTFTPELQGSLPAQVHVSQGHSQPLVVLEETAEVLLVADPKEAGGPAAWRSGAQAPTVIAISRRAVLATVSPNAPL